MQGDPSPPYQGMLENLLLAPEAVGHPAAEPKRESEEHHASEPELCKGSGGGVARLEATEPRGATPSVPLRPPGETFAAIAAKTTGRAKGKSAPPAAPHFRRW